MSKLIIEIKVIPNAGKSELIKTESGYRARLAAPPVDGKANEKLIELLSKEFKIAKREIEIIKGLTSRNKTIMLNISDIFLFEERLQGDSKKESCPSKKEKT